MRALLRRPRWSPSAPGTPDPRVRAAARDRLGGGALQRVGRGDRADRLRHGGLRCSPQYGGGPFSPLVDPTAAPQHPATPQLYLICVVLIGAAAGHRDAAARARAGPRCAPASASSGATSPSPGCRWRSSAASGGRPASPTCNAATADAAGAAAPRASSGATGRPDPGRPPEPARRLARPSPQRRADGLVRPDRRRAPTPDPARRRPCRCSSRREDRASFSLHMVDVTEPAGAAGAAAGRARLHPGGDRHRQQHDRADRRDGTVIAANPATTHADRLHRGRARRPAVRGSLLIAETSSAPRSEPLRAPRTLPRTRRGTAADQGRRAAGGGRSPTTCTRPAPTHPSPS